MRIGFASLPPAAAIDAIAVGHELVLTGAIMHEERVGITASPNRKRLPGADRDDMNSDPARRSKERQDLAE